MKKRLNITIFFVMFFILILCSSFAFSAGNDPRPDYDQSLAYEWLLNELEESSWDVPVKTLSWAILALANGGYNYDEGVDMLWTKENGNNWNGVVSDAALAIMALDGVGEDVDEQIAWLLEQQDIVTSGGEWLVQFNPTGSGPDTFIITYNGVDFSFTVDQTDIIPADGCPLIDDVWVDFRNCIKGGGIGLYESFSVSCLSGFSSSLLFRTGSESNYEYYIIDESSPLEIENGRFSDCANSQYGAWALDEVGNRSYVIPYLKRNCNEDVIDNAFLYLLTSENRYSDNLENTQSPEGSWDSGNIYQTALALISLKKGSAFSSAVTDAEDWLEWRQDRTTGSWNQNPEWTAFVLYALTDGSGYSTPAPGFCGNGILENGEECENNSHCFFGEQCQGCQCIAVNFSCTIADPDAECDENTPCPSDQICNPVSCICEGTTYIECTSDYDCYSGEICVNGQCVPSGGDDYTECTYDSDCGPGEICVSGTCIEEEKSSWLTWLIVILVVILGLVGGYFAYMKFFKGKGGTKFGAKPGIKPPGSVSPFQKANYPKTRQRVPFAAVRRPIRTGRADTKTESELDTALAKAKKIIGK